MFVKLCLSTFQDVPAPPTLETALEELIDAMDHEAEDVPANASVRETPTPAEVHIEHEQVTQESQDNSGITRPTETTATETRVPAESPSVASAPTSAPPPQTLGQQPAEQLSVPLEPETHHLEPEFKPESKQQPTNEGSDQTAAIATATGSPAGEMVAPASTSATLRCIVSNEY